MAEGREPRPMMNLVKIVGAITGIAAIIVRSSAFVNETVNGASTRGASWWVITITLAIVAAYIVVLCVSMIKNRRNHFRVLDYNLALAIKDAGGTDATVKVNQRVRPLKPDLIGHKFQYFCTGSIPLGSVSWSILNHQHATTNVWPRSQESPRRDIYVRFPQKLSPSWWAHLVPAAFEVDVIEFSGQLDMHNAFTRDIEDYEFDTGKPGYATFSRVSLTIQFPQGRGPTQYGAELVSNNALEELPLIATGATTLSLSLKRKLAGETIRIWWRWNPERPPGSSANGTGETPITAAS